MRRFLTTSLVIIFTLTSQPSQATHTIEKRANSSALASPGLLVVDESTSETLVSNKPDSLRVPASVLKLATGVVAINNLGTETRFATSIWRTDNEREFLIRGTLDPFLSTSRAISDKYGHKYLPGLILKANEKHFKKFTIFYEGLYPKDISNLQTAMKYRKWKVDFIEVSKEKAIEIGREEEASLTSLPLSKIISHTMMWSDNLVADRLANAAARSHGNSTTKSGLTSTYKSILSELGVNSDGLAIFDGSGLSKKNRISPRTIVELLMLIRKDSKYSSIYEGLPIAGETGTLVKRFKDTPAAIGAVKAKTGWVNRSVTLAGYVKSGEKEYAFAILADGIMPTLRYRNRARAAMDKLLETIVKGDH